MQFQSPSRWLGAGTSVLALLVACGGGSDSAVPMQAQGVVLDAQAQGNRVYLDLNNNQAFDAGEPMSAPIAADGTFQLQIGSPTPAELANATLVVDTPNAQLLAPAAAFVYTDVLGRQHTSNVVISPLSTLVGAEVAWNGLTPEQAVAAVQKQLGLDADPLSNYSATGDAALQARAMQAAAGLANLKQRGTPEGETGVMYVAQLTRGLASGDMAAALPPQSAAMQSANERFIVRLRDAEPDPADKGQKAAAAHNGAVGQVFSRVMKGYSITVPKAESAALLNALQQDASVEQVEFDRPVTTLQATQTNATWGLDRTDQRYLPLDTMYAFNATGTGVRAYIVDTGIRATHIDLAGHVLAGFTAINDVNKTNDCHGHGTHVAGTVGGARWGMAKNVMLVPVRVLDCSGSGSVAGVIAGLDWVAANAVKPAVVNMSIGGAASQLLDDAVGRVVAKGITVVVAAGNDYGSNACNYSPARAVDALAVAASTSSDTRAAFSNTGTCVGVFAPGNLITSAGITSDTATAVMSGTSMASPHVAGLAALYLQTHVAAAPADVIAAIKNSATLDQIADAGAGSPTSLIYNDLTSPSPFPEPGISAPISSPISAPISAPPSTTPSPSSVSVGALAGSAAIVKKSWQAKVTVAVQNQLGVLVPGVAVKGAFSSRPTSAISCTTAANGTCVIASGNLAMTLGSVQFSVTGMTGKKVNWSYDPTRNVRTSVNINRPS